eukprot:1177578-Prorocentrum_minimum.AAC.3
MDVVVVVPRLAFRIEKEYGASCVPLENKEGDVGSMASFLCRCGHFLVWERGASSPYSYRLLSCPIFR